MKYNVLAETGIGNLLKPYLVKAVVTGFLMPADYEGNLYAERAVKLFGEAYRICTDKDKTKEKELHFIHNYASTAFEKIEPYLQFNVREVLDLMADITKVPPMNKGSMDDELPDISGLEIEDRHHCELCDLIDIWDIKLELVHSEDAYNNVLIAGLLRALDTYNLELFDILL